MQCITDALFDAFLTIANSSLDSSQTEIITQPNIKSESETIKK